MNENARSGPGIGVSWPHCALQPFQVAARQLLDEGSRLHLAINHYLGDLLPGRRHPGVVETPHDRRQVVLGAGDKIGRKATAQPAA